MHETSKAVQRRLHDSNFITRYFRGNGIDIGAGNDPLDQYQELFPFISTVFVFDRAEGDAEIMAGVENERYDFVHSSHCLEDTDAPAVALQNWFRILKPGGYLIVTVPDEDMYEQGIFPSTFNSDHKWTFTIFKKKSWSRHSINLLSMIRGLGDDAELIKIEQLTATYRYNVPRMDQTRTPVGEAAIEFVVRKRHRPDITDDLPMKEDTNPTYTYQKRTPLPERPKIALHRPGAIGDIIMTLSLVPLLKRKYPDHEIHYFCHSSMAGLGRLMKAAGISRGIDCGLLEERRGEYEKVINLVGYPLSEGYPEKPMAKHLIWYFADEMGIGLEDYMDSQFPHLTLDIGQRPTGDHHTKGYATIHPQAGWSAYKNWDTARWEEIIARRPDIRFYQIGSADDARLKGVDHWFMGKPLDDSIDLMAHASLHMGVDSWTNHLTNIQWIAGTSDRTPLIESARFTPAIILWGSTQASAAGYQRNTNISLGLPCQPCFREDPKISRMPRGPCINPPGQDYDHPQHACMAGISVDMVLDEIEKLWPSA